jgi:hypothetical protein
VTDGVVVEEERLELQTAVVGATIFANAQGRDTDLTGFSLLKNDAQAVQRKELLQGVAGRLDNHPPAAHFYRPDQDALSGQDEELDLQEEVRRRIKVLLTGSGTGLTLTLFNPILGVPTTLAALVSTYALKPRERDQALVRLRARTETTINEELGSLRTFLEG